MRVPSDERLNVLLERVDPERNMARYYVLSIEASLFGDTALVREWGRIGRGRRPVGRRIHLFEHPGVAVEMLEAWCERKRARGYRERGRDTS